MQSGESLLCPSVSRAVSEYWLVLFSVTGLGKRKLLGWHPHGSFLKMYLGV